MKLRTSYFNATVLKKDITRFAPIWGLYTVFMLLTLLLVGDVVRDVGGPESSGDFLTAMPGIMTVMSSLNFFYCGLSALLLFADLSNGRLCNALHAMPMRREGWFLTHLAAGFLFCAVPNTLGALLGAYLLGEFWYTAFIWLALMLLQFLFFFGAGVFSAMCAGNRLGTLVMYLLVNYPFMIVGWLVQSFYSPLLPGMVVDMTKWIELCPVVGLAAKEYIAVEWNPVVSYNGTLPADWQYLLLIGAVGVALLVLSLLIYRKRKLESAGDFISAKPAAPVFLILYTLCVGAVMNAMGSVSSEGVSWFMLTVGLAIGFFTGKMLLERRVNIFGKKTFLGFGIFVAAFALSMAVTAMDPLGVTRYVPDPTQVERVRLSPYNSVYYVNQKRYQLTDPADIAAVTQLHTALVEDRGDTAGENTASVYLIYDLKNGTSVQRHYMVPTESVSRDSAAQLLRQLSSQPEVVLGTEDMEYLLENLKRLEFYPGDVDIPGIVMAVHGLWVDTKGDGEGKQFLFNGNFLGQPEAEALIRALEADCKEGTMAQDWNLNRGIGQVGNITMEVSREDGGTDYLDLVIYATNKNTIACLKDLAKKN